MSIVQKLGRFGLEHAQRQPGAEVCEANRIRSRTRALAAQGSGSSGRYSPMQRRIVDGTGGACSIWQATENLAGVGGRVGGFAKGNTGSEAGRLSRSG